MSLRQIRDGHVFDDVTTDGQRARVYVPSRELGLESEDPPESRLMRALTDGASPQRLQIVGPSGSGKTSLILRVFRDLAHRALDVQHEVLVLRVGDRPERLASSEDVMKMVLETVKVEGHRFSNIEDAVLRDAAADQRTRTGTQVEHGGALTAPVVSYSVAIKEAYESASFNQNAPQVRNDLVDVLAQVARAGYRPVLVIDDTEKFVSPGVDGKLDVQSIENLYHHGVRALGELEVDLVVAMHPRFAEVDRVTDVVERHAMQRIDVPELPPRVEDPPPLGRILTRRVEHAGLDTDLDRLIVRSAVDELQALYYERGCDLRSVLKLAQAAAENAVGRGATSIDAFDVQEVLARAAR